MLTDAAISSKPTFVNSSLFNPIDIAAPADDEENNMYAKNCKITEQNI